MEQTLGQWKMYKLSTVKQTPTDDWLKHLVEGRHHLEEFITLYEANSAVAETRFKRAAEGAEMSEKDRRLAWRDCELFYLSCCMEPGLTEMC